MSILKPEPQTGNDLQAAKIALIMQLRRNGISDTAVLNAIESVPREWFVAPTFIDYAYDDRALPIEQEQTISQPTIVAMMTQALELHDRHTVLEIGTGSGYQSAILSRMVRWVHTVERHKPLLDGAKGLFSKLNIRNVMAHHADGMKGWPHAAPYERIIVTAAAFDDVPMPLLEQLSDNGLMIIPIEQKPGEQTLYRVKKQLDTFVKTPLCKVLFVPLVAA